MRLGSIPGGRDGRPLLAWTLSNTGDADPPQGMALRNPVFGGDADDRLVASAVCASHRGLLD